MGLWVRRLRLDPRERLRWQVACNWSQRGIARGGRLALTSQALVFEPNRLDGVTGGKAMRIPLNKVKSVSVEPGGLPRASPFGGIRPRMRLELIDGSTELILLNNLERRIADVRSLSGRTEHN